jgi:HK97 gp10 family phage protein
VSVDLSLDLSGLDELVRELPGLADKFVRATALDVEATAKRLAPVDTGLLRNSIRLDDPVRGDAQADVVVGAEYGIYVHEGAQGRRPQRFLADALRQVEGRSENRLQEMARRMEKR